MYFPRVETCLNCGKDFWAGPKDNGICFTCSFLKNKEAEAKQKEQTKFDQRSTTLEKQKPVQQTKRGREKPTDVPAATSIGQSIATVVSATKKKLQRRQDLIDRQNLRQGYVYLMRAENGLYKIGFSKEVEKRRQALERDVPMKIRIIHYFSCKNMGTVEKRLHKKYASKRVGFEWFRLEDKDVAWIVSLNDGDLDN